MPLNDIDTEFLFLESQIITCVRRVAPILVSIKLLDLLEETLEVSSWSEKVVI